MQSKKASGAVSKSAKKRVKQRSGKVSKTTAKRSSKKAPSRSSKRSTADAERRPILVPLDFSAYSEAALEYAGRLADFLEFGELMCRDALLRDESCGCHLREEFQTAEGEAQRNDEEFAHVAVFEYQGDGQTPELTKEPLEFEALPLATRNYKT